jgi:salicylate hydroxylase
MMNIGIVGAGIAGLGAAIALRRAGHHVEIYEKSSFKNEIGAAILMTPNANRVLRHWGFDFDKARPVDFKQFRFVHSDSLKVALHHDFSGVEKQFGERMCAYHRVDLHGGLRELAEKAGTDIRLGCEVVAIDEERGEVELKNGDKITKDLWILADGCHCPFLPQIAQEDIPTVKIGKSVARWLAPFEKVMENPDCAKLWGGQGAGFCTFFNERGLLLVTYPCRGGTLLNCALFHDTHPEDREKVGWNEDTTLEKVLAELEGCSDAVRYLPS